MALYSRVAQTRNDERKLMFPNVFMILTFASDDAAAGIVGLLMLLILLVAGLAFYFLPSLIAILRSHHQWGAIAVINLFFGWTFIGWVVALAWSVSAARERSP